MRTLPRAHYVVTATAARLVSEATTIVVVLVGTERGVSAATLGLLVAAWTFPQFATAPVVGAAADRSPRPAWLLGALVAAGGLGLAVIGAGVGAVPIVALLPAALLVALAEPASMGALSGIATRSGGAGFEAWDAAAYGAAGMVGQLLVAVAAAVAGASSTLVVLIVVAAGAVILTASLPLQPGAATPGRSAGSRAAVRALTTDPELRSMTLLTTISMSAFGGVALVAVDLAARHGRAAAGGGQLVLALAAGAALGSLAWTRLRPPARPLRTAAGSVAIVGLAFLVSGLGGWGIAALAFFVAGVADAPLLVATFASRNRRSPDAVRASVYTIAASLKIAATSIGALIVGVVLTVGDGRAGPLTLAAIQALALAAFAVARPPAGHQPGGIRIEGTTDAGARAATRVWPRVRRSPSRSRRAAW